MKLQSGDILICRGHSWISRAIMRITRGTWSHACIVAETWGELGVIEAQKNGVNFKLWQTWVNKWGYTYRAFRYTIPFNESDLMHKAFAPVGELKYDWFTFFRRAFGNRKQRTYEQETKRMICSEYVAWVWNIEGAYDITPQELYDYLITSEDWKELI